MLFMIWWRAWDTHGPGIHVCVFSIPPFYNLCFNFGKPQSSVQLERCSWYVGTSYTVAWNSWAFVIKFMLYLISYMYFIVAVPLLAHGSLLLDRGLASLDLCSHCNSWTVMKLTTLFQLKPRVHCTHRSSSIILLLTIQAHVHLGTVIHSDCWTSYYHVINLQVGTLCWNFFWSFWPCSSDSNFSAPKYGHTHQPPFLLVAMSKFTVKLQGAFQAADTSKHRV